MDLFSFQTPQMPIIKPIAKELAEANYASEFANILLKQIQVFDEQLDNEHEVGVRLVSFGQTYTFSVTSIGYENPSLIIFNGINEEMPIQLIQHVTQISFLLTSLQRQNKEVPKRLIGFQF